MAPDNFKNLGLEFKGDELGKNSKVSSISTRKDDNAWLWGNLVHRITKIDCEEYEN